MKVLIVYSSQSGNTKKLAQAAYDAVSQDKEIFPVEDAPLGDGYDVVIVGFWLKAGKPDPKTQEYLEKIGNGQKLFLFATHGAAPGSDHAKNAMNFARDLAENAEIIGTFSCQGEVNPKVLEKVKAKPEPPVWLSDADDAVGHPDENDIESFKNALQKAI